MFKRLILLAVTSISTGRSVSQSTKILCFLAVMVFALGGCNLAWRSSVCVCVCEGVCLCLCHLAKRGRGNGSDLLQKGA